MELHKRNVTKINFFLDVWEQCNLQLDSTWANKTDQITVMDIVADYCKEYILFSKICAYCFSNSH